MGKDYLTDEQVALEIERLTGTEEVKLARAEQRMKYKRRQYYYTLRYLHKRGKQLMEQGITAGDLEFEEDEMRINIGTEEILR